MIKNLIATSVLALLLCGCVNCIVRHSTNPPHIESVYQPTRMASGATIVLACPQMMSDAPSDNGFSAVNIVTIPLGIVAFCVDVPLEFVLDTVCLPYDAFADGKPMENASARSSNEDTRDVAGKAGSAPHAPYGRRSEVK